MLQRLPVMGKEISMSPHKIACESFHLVQSNEAETTVSKCPAVGRTVPLAMGLEQAPELT